MSEYRAEELERVPVTEEQPPPPAPGRVALFGLCMLLFLGGFALMALGATEESIALFTAGIASSGLAFFIGLNRSGR